MRLPPVVVGAGDSHSPVTSTEDESFPAMLCALPEKGGGGRTQMCGGRGRGGKTRGRGAGGVGTGRGSSRKAHLASDSRQPPLTRVSNASDLVLYTCHNMPFVGVLKLFT